MKKLSRWICGVGICILSAAVLAGCGDGTGEGNSDISSYGRTEEVSRSSEELLIMNYEIKYNNGEFLMEDYKELAELYAQAGLIRKQRDLLEQSFRLYEDLQAYEILQGLYVNLAEEDADIQEQAALMLLNLEAGEYRGESIHMIESDEWFYTMMPKMGEGVRNYFLQEDGRTRLLIRVGYDEEGIPFSTVWYHGENDSITLLKKISGTVRIMDTAFKDGAYEGPFTLWILDGITGSILKEQGTFSEGSYAGEYTLDIYRGAGAGDPYDLWNNRENMEYASYTGQIDEQGQGNIQQFAGEFETYPVFEVYEPAENENNSGESGEAVPQVRIYDGVIQVMSGTAWISLGDVEQYRNEDPFRVYAELRQQKDAGIQDSGLVFDDIAPEASAEPTPASTPESTQRPASTPAPSVNRPAATPTPAPSVNRPAATPTPAPAPVPVPDDDDDDDDDDGGSGDNNNNSGGNSNDNNGDAGGSDNGGNDVDIEWTDDIL